MATKNIVFTEWGIANNFSDRIEMNVNLKKKEYDKLYNKILRHELRHDPGAYSYQDMKNDFLIDGPNTWDLVRFCIKHPKATVQFLPFIKSQGKWYFDISVFVIWIFCLIVIGGLTGFIWFMLMTL